MLRRAHHIAVSLFLEETGELGITTRQFGILLLLKHRPASTRFRWRSSGARPLDHRHGPDQARSRRPRRPHVGGIDRRKRSLALTAAGESMLARLKEPARRAQARSSPRSNREQEAVPGAARQIHSHLQRIHARSARGAFPAKPREKVLAAYWRGAASRSPAANFVLEHVYAYRRRDYLRIKIAKSTQRPCVQCRKGIFDARAGIKPTFLSLAVNVRDHKRRPYKWITYVYGLVGTMVRRPQQPPRQLSLETAPGVDTILVEGIIHCPHVSNHPRRKKAASC